MTKEKVVVVSEEDMSYPERALYQAILALDEDLSHDFSYPLRTVRTEVLLLAALSEYSENETFTPDDAEKKIDEMCVNRAIEVGLITKVGEDAYQLNKPLLRELVKTPNDFNNIRDKMMDGWKKLELGKRLFKRIQEGPVKTCPTCEGHNTISVDHPDGGIVDVPCPECGGDSVVPAEPKYEEDAIFADPVFMLNIKRRSN